ENEKQGPITFNLSQNYPNPFNPSTLIQYSIPKTSRVNITIYDVLGNEVSVILNEEKLTGNYEIEFSAADLPSGVYFYQLKTGNNVRTKKMILMK
ncbi:MAG: T9SS type A sorting domain-containing protein, partial [Ignavibacteriaceae bacterium]|nr:T9SS type A sorting domain-containing protein [Ignavibacteriaceae bacterium]